MHHNADEVTLYALGRDPLTLQGIVGYEESLEDFSDRDGRRLRQARDLTLVYDAAGPFAIDDDHPYGAIGTPEIKATVVIDDVEYAVASIASQSKTFVRFNLVQTHVIDKSRAHYRPRV
jgi:hypothetical protein